MDEEDEPTKVQKRGSADEFRATVLDLHRLLSQIEPDDDEPSGATPRVNNVGGMLREIQRERFDALARKRTDTLTSGEALEAKNRAHPARRRRTKSAPVWPVIVATALLAAALVCAGVLINRATHTRTATNGAVQVKWDVAPGEVSVTIDGKKQLNRGTGNFPCTSGVDVLVAAPGEPGEKHQLACGSDFVLRLDLGQPSK